MLNGYRFFTSSDFTVLCTALSYLLILLIPVAAFRLVKIISSVRDRSLQMIWLLLALFYAGLMVVYFPGFVGYDDGFTYSLVTQGQAWGWQSLTYSIFLASGLMISGGLGSAVVTCIFIFLFLTAKVLKQIDVSGLSSCYKTALALMLLVLSLHPIHQGLLLFQTRDILFSLVLIYVGLQFFEPAPTRLRVLFLTLVLILLGDFRQEAKIYLILVPVLFFVLRKWQIRHVVIFAAAGLVGAVGYYKMLPRYLNIDSYSYDYEITAYVLPLSQIFYDVPAENISAEHVENIDRVFSVAALKEYFNPVDIDPFHQGGLKWPIAPPAMEQFRYSAFELFKQYPELVLKNRVYLMASMMNLGQPWPLFFDDCLRECDEGLVYKHAKLTAPENYQLAPTAVEYKEWIKKSINNEKTLLYIFCSLLIPLVFLFFAFGYTYWYPALGAFALIIGIRLPILFLLAPAGYLKYVYSVFLFFTFASVILLLHVFKRRGMAQ